MTWLQSSELEELKQATNPPIGEQRRLLSDALRKTRNTLQTIEDDILNKGTSPKSTRTNTNSSKVDTVVELEKRRNLLLTTIADLERILAPIRLLPVEILEVCFGYCALIDSRAVTGGSYSVTNGPWYLGHVCRRWRAIAIACPSLWTTVQIDLKKDAVSDLPVVQEGFIRAQEHLISLSIEVFSVKSGSVFSNLIYPQCPRIKELSITMLDASAIVMKEFPIPFLKMDHLRLLRLRVSSILGQRRLRTSIAECIFPIKEFIGAPSFTALDVNFELDPQLVTIPWHQLTSLSTFSDDAQLHLILSLCPNLVSLRSPRRDPFLFIGSSHIPYPVIVHKKLQEFSTFRANIFMSIVTPGLKKLTLGPSTMDMDTLPEQLSHLLSLNDTSVKSEDGKSGQLETFILRLGGIYTSVIAPLLPLYTLQILHLTLIYDTDAMIELVKTLVVEDGYSTFLPDLNTLGIKFSGVPMKLESFTFLGHNFVRMVESREDTLRSLYIENIHTHVREMPRIPLDEEDLRRLNVVRSKGVKLDILGI